VCIQLIFEWDENKNLANQKKHEGISFELAARVFDDENLLILEDRTNGGEQRWHALGSVGAAIILVVVHTYRETENGEEIIRIISARAAEKREIRRYFQQAADEAGKRCA
jgi:uncharacterized DUF497 family protein